MTTTATATPGSHTWTEAQITDVIIELLAGMLHESVDGLRTKLLSEGSSMPVDSLDLFDVLAEFHQRTGLRIPKRKLRTATLRSVGAFAAFAAKEASS